MKINLPLNLKQLKIPFILLLPGLIFLTPTYLTAKTISGGSSQELSNQELSTKEDLKTNDLLNKAYQEILLDKNPYQQAQLWVLLIKNSYLSNPSLAWKALQKLSYFKDLENFPRLSSQLLAYQSYLYFQQQKSTQALGLIQQAIFVAQQEADLLMQWEWHQGRILTAIDPQAALRSYRRSVSHLHEIRMDIPVRYIDGRSSYREMLAPLYLEYTKLLLQLANNKDQKLLREAQTVIESLKVAELHDYFKNSCAIKQHPLTDMTSNSPKTAFIYPIIFKNSLEILLEIDNHIQHFSIKVSQYTLEKTIYMALRRIKAMFKGRLRRFSQFEVGRLYQWLIKPLEKELEKYNINTLVFIPDGVLRMLPNAVLWDGKQYLIEKYAMVTSPGLTLTDPKPLLRQNIQGNNILLAGLSKPGGVVNELPGSMQQSLINDKSIISAQRNIQSHSRPIISGNISGKTDNLNQQAELINDSSLIDKPLVLRQIQIEQIQNNLALPGVKQEINQLEKIAKTDAIIDDEFKLELFKQKSKSAHIIHIASHAMFSGEPESSFIMTHDHLIDLKMLTDLFKYRANKSESNNDGVVVDLLVLSACQTAEGDDRSPLGLSGVALQSGARSILGSLWSVSDDAAKILFPEFYTRLISDKLLTKAKALQRAQISLLKNKQMSHPFYWAPFILIGNWL